MQVIKDALDTKDMEKIFQVLNYIADKEAWVPNQVIWTPDLLEAQYGVVTIAKMKDEGAELIKDMFRPHLPQCKELAAHFTMWFANSGIAWHNDEGYEFGATFYLNQVWNRNWGGYYLYEEDDIIKAVKPKFNTLVINDKHEYHHVTQVSSAAPEPRCTIQLWGKK